MTSTKKLGAPPRRSAKSNSQGCSEAEAQSSQQDSVTFNDLFVTTNESGVSTKKPRGRPRKYEQTEAEPTELGDRSHTSMQSGGSQPDSELGNDLSRTAKHPPRQNKRFKGQPKKPDGNEETLSAESDGQNHRGIRSTKPEANSELCETSNKSDIMAKKFRGRPRKFDQAASSAESGRQNHPRMGLEKLKANSELCEGSEKSDIVAKRPKGQPGKSGLEASSAKSGSRNHPRTGSEKPQVTPEVPDDLPQTSEKSNAVTKRPRGRPRKSDESQGEPSAETSNQKVSGTGSRKPQPNLQLSDNIPIRSDESGSLTKRQRGQLRKSDGSQGSLSAVEDSQSSVEGKAVELKQNASPGTILRVPTAPIDGSSKQTRGRSKKANTSSEVLSTELRGQDDPLESSVTITDSASCVSPTDSSEKRLMRRPRRGAKVSASKPPVSEALPSNSHASKVASNDEDVRQSGQDEVHGSPGPNVDSRPQSIKRKRGRSRKETSPDPSSLLKQKTPKTALGSPNRFAMADEGNRNHETTEPVGGDVSSVEEVTSHPEGMSAASTSAVEYLTAASSAVGESDHTGGDQSQPPIAPAARKRGRGRARKQINLPSHSASPTPITDTNATTASSCVTSAEDDQTSQEPVSKKLRTHSQRNSSKTSPVENCLSAVQRCLIASSEGEVEVPVTPPPQLKQTTKKGRSMKRSRNLTKAPQNPDISTHPLSPEAMAINTATVVCPKSHGMSLQAEDENAEGSAKKKVRFKSRNASAGLASQLVVTAITLRLFNISAKNLQ